MTLTGEQLQRLARDVAGALAGTSHGRPFTPHLEVWKIPGKVFLIITDDDPDAQIITVKVDPHHGDALRRDHESITAGRYLDKRHWLSVGAGRGVTTHLVEDLVQGCHPRRRAGCGFLPPTTVRSGGGELAHSPTRT